ncbi:DUF5336 domain-containing protein [Geoglobus acetivorans]|uniref:DUF5336 domain-containing protein n=1 Tax=Geoglobus acetivorans TaxID=565033 RepID=UPI00064F4350
MNLRHSIAVVVLGIVSGLIVFGAMSTFEKIRGFQAFLATSIAISCALTALYLAAIGKLGDRRLLFFSAFAVLVISLAAFTLVLGFALKSEQGMWLHVRKVEVDNACIPVSEEELNRYPTLKKAIESAMNSGSAIVEIPNEDSKELGKYFGKCVSYRGQEFEIMLAVT